MTASFPALVQFVTFDEEFRLSPLALWKLFLVTGTEVPGGGGGRGVLPYSTARNY